MNGLVVFDNLAPIWGTYYARVKLAIFDWDIATMNTPPTILAPIISHPKVGRKLIIGGIRIAHTRGYIHLLINTNTITANGRFSPYRPQLEFIITDINKIPRQVIAKPPPKGLIFANYVLPENLIYDYCVMGEYSVLERLLHTLYLSPKNTSKLYALFENIWAIVDGYLGEPHG